MANVSTYKVDLNTPRPNPNNPLEVRKGDAPKTAFQKINNAIDFFGNRIDGATVFSNTAPSPAVAYMSWIDTSVNPALLKRRNANNNAWVTIGPAFQAFGKDTDGTPLLRRDMNNLVEPGNPTPVLTNLSAEPRYVSTIDLTGLSTNRYYPVWWSYASLKVGHPKFAISRANNDNADLDPFNTGDNLVAGLILEFEQASIRSSLTIPSYLHITLLAQTLRKTVRNIRHHMRCSSVLPAEGQISENGWVNGAINPYRSGMYLRGGLTYTVVSNYHKSLNYSTVDTEVQVSSSSTSGTKGRFMAKSYDINDPFLGPDYDDFMSAYNAFPYTL